VHKTFDLIQNSGYMGHKFTYWRSNWILYITFIIIFTAVVSGTIQISLLPSERISGLY